MKKIKNGIIGFFLAFIALFAISVAGVFTVRSSQTAYAASTSDLVFSPALREDGYSVAPVNKDISGALVIPSTYNGKSVVEIYTTIGSFAFNGCTKLTSVVIPDSIKSIGENAFGGCSGLTSVTLSKNLTRIERSTFYGCKGLTSIVIPEGVTSIGVGAFESCSNLKDISLPDSLTYLNDNVFGSCNSLTEITLPSGLTGIGRYCFSSCSSLKTITFKGSSEQWAAVKKESKDAVPSSIKIVCLGDIANEISADIENDGVTNGSVTVTYSGYSVNGYYDRDSNSTPASANTLFSSGTTFTEEGYYRVEARNSYAEPAILYFTIDKTAPTGTLNNVTDGGYTNKDVTFTWTDAGATATLNDSSYASGQTISAERTHTIVLTDRAGNSTTYTFTIDKTAPTGTLNNVTDGGYTKKNVTFTWTEVGATVTLNGNAYTSGKTISSEGAHTIVLTDRAGNSTTYTFTIDKTAPTGTLSGVTHGGYTNKNVTFTWTDAEATATLNGSAYNSGQTISSEGGYTIVLTDRAGNNMMYWFTIDKTAPAGTLSGVTHGGYTNKNVTFAWSEAGATATLNGSAYTSGQTISAERTHTIVLTDRAGNSTAYTFTIDKTAPTGTLSGATNGGYTNRDVTFAWTDAGATATLNGTSYTSGQTISAERTHTIVLTDRAGNSTTYTFTIDKTAPTGTLNNVTDGGYTNSDVTFTWTDAEATATLNGNAYTSGRKISAEGAHTIVLTDRAGNSTSYTFTIDKTAPVIDAYNTYTNAEFTMTARDKYCSIGAWEYRLDSGEIKRSQTQSLTLGGNAGYNGVWSIRVIDELGNTSNWVNVNHVYRETFGNSEGIYNSFSVPSYYVVTLSQKNYTSCFGAYTFADYTAALDFAVNKEWECRVIELDGGKSWNYVNPTNENTRQIYTDRAELDEVIDKYARKNIGDRKVMSKNGAVLNNPTDGSGVTRADALTRQLAELPGLLSAYSDYRYMLALPSYSLSTPQTVVDGNKATATIQFISDGISLRIGEEKPLSYGDKISTALNAAGEQGWYLITERDVCGNVEKYLIFVDVQQPELYASVTYGNRNKELVNFNQTYIDENTETMRYIEFDICSLTDNIDDYVMVSIEGRNAGVQYVWGEGRRASRTELRERILRRLYNNSL